jgi:hypothetical protein
MVRLQTWIWIVLGAAAGAAAQNPSANCGVQPLGGQWPATAQFVSGLNRGVTSGSLQSEQEAAWVAYSKISSADWSALEKRYLTRIDGWRGRALANLPAGGTAFYPFGGPDAANLLAFFPDAREYVIVGLEPIGCLPLRTLDYNEAYFSALRGDLNSVVANGFFRTNEMGGDFKEGAVNGVFPLLLFLLARSGYSVEEAAPIQISSSGTLVSPSQGAGPPKAETDGVAIRFSDSRHGSRMLRYFALNLQSSRLNRKPGTLKYLNGLPAPVTLIKSASYLLHKTYFGTIRDLILSKSALVVEDDSGIPYHYFDAAHWDVRLYGKYTGPIALFKMWKQDDLKAAYGARKEKQPLDFGIGYRHPGESNLLVAVKRVTGSR